MENVNSLEHGPICSGFCDSCFFFSVSQLVYDMCEERVYDQERDWSGLFPDGKGQMEFSVRDVCRVMLKSPAFCRAGHATYLSVCSSLQNMRLKS